MSKYFKQLLCAVFGALIILALSACTGSSDANSQYGITNCKTAEYVMNENITIPLDDITVATSNEPTISSIESEHAEEGIGGDYRECYIHAAHFHMFDLFIGELVSLEAFQGWAEPLRAMRTSPYDECLMNLSTFIEHFGISEEVFQEFVSSNIWHYFWFGGDVISILYSGDRSLIEQFFSIGNEGWLYQQRRDREARYWSERVVAAQQQINKNTTEMSWHFHDIWTYIYFADDLGWYYRRWMRDLVIAGEYDRVNIVEFISHFGLDRESSLSPGKTIFEHWATEHNMNIFIHYNLEILLSGDPELIRAYYSIENEAAHTAQVQARFDEYVAIHGMPDTSWMIAATPPPPDRTDLIAAIEVAEGITRQNYTFLSWTDFQEALMRARSTRDNPNSTQLQRERAAERLWDAIDGLVEAPPPTPPPDRTDLIAAIEAAESRNQQNYTFVSWTDLQEALRIAISRRDDEATPQNHIDTAARRLWDAINGLVEAPSSTPPPDIPT